MITLLLSLILNQSFTTQYGIGGTNGATISLPNSWAKTDQGLTHRRRRKLLGSIGREDLAGRVDEVISTGFICKSGQKEPRVVLLAVGFQFIQVMTNCRVFKNKRKLHQPLME